MKIAIIPARGGSKRIINKNVKKFCGKPIIAYSIETAKKSKLFDRIIISTDNKKIAKIAKQYGGEVPFIRPKSLSGDYTGTAEVIAHAVNLIKEKSKKTKKLVLVEDGWKNFGYSAEIMAIVSESNIKLDEAPQRVCWPNSHVPMSSPLEKDFYLGKKMRQFICQHYALSSRRDTPYWKHVTEEITYDNVTAKFEPPKHPNPQENSFVELAFRLNIYKDFDTSMKGIAYIATGMGYGPIDISDILLRDARTPIEEKKVVNNWKKTNSSDYQQIIS